MRSPQALLSEGMGWPGPSPELREARAALTKRERRAVQRLVRRGEPAWDEPSARYAIATARATRSLPSIGSSTGMRLVAGVVALLQGANAVEDVVDGRWIGAFVSGAVAVLFVGFVIRGPYWVGQAERAERQNQHLLTETSGLPTSPPSSPPPQSRDPSAIAIAIFVSAVPFGIAMAVGEEDVGWIEGLATGAVFGVAFVALMRWLARRSHPARSANT